jgi:glutamyl-tRNA reductase
VDLALPPDIDPEAARALGFERVGMEEINAAAAGNQRRRRRDSADARALVDDALDRVHRRLGLRSVESVVTILQDHYRETALAGAEDLLRRELGDLDPEGASAVRRWAEALARRFAHLSSRGLREVALQAGPEALSAFLSGAERDLARKLVEALDTDRVLAALPPDEEDPP